MSNFVTSNALVLESADAANTIGDAAGQTGKTYELKNNTVNPQVWSVSAGLGFTVGGVNSATLTLAAGQSARVYSNGTRWLAVVGISGRPIFAGTAVSDASGNATFTFPAGTFAAAPVADISIQAAASQNPIDYRIVTLTATSMVVNVRQSPALIILSLSVLGLSAPLAGVTVHAIATPAGTTP